MKRIANKIVKLFRLLTQLAIAASVDFSNGIFIAVWISRIFSVELSIGLVLLAMIMSVSLDADFLIKRHDESHKPIPVIGALLLLTWLTWSTGIGVLFLMWACSVFVHCVHDSIGDDNSGGVAWGWPINKLFLTILLSSHLLTKHLGKRAEVLLVCPHTREELTPAIGTLRWLRFYYGKVTPQMLWSLGYSGTAIISAVWLATH